MALLPKPRKYKETSRKTPSYIKDKLSYAGITYHRGEKLQNLPIPDEAEAWLECKTTKTIPTGDHELFIATVEAAYTTEDFQEYWKYQKYKLPLYIGINTQKINKYVEFKTHQDAGGGI